jgi:ketopantoate reductase
MPRATGASSDRLNLPVSTDSSSGHLVFDEPDNSRKNGASNLADRCGDAGNRLELDWLAGKVVALGRKYGISTPGHEAVYAILKPYRMGRQT